MPVVDRQSNRIDLSRQDGAVDASVLEHLRHALHLNKFFHHLDLSYNVLDDECISMLCTIIKDRNYLKTFSLVSCGITDMMLALKLIPALCARGMQIALLDLNKNEGVTDKSVDAICHLIRDVNILDLRLSGVQINPSAAKRLLKVLECNTTLEHFELPFTVGFEVLNRVKLLLRRNSRRVKDTSRLEGVDGVNSVARDECSSLGSPDNLMLCDIHASKFAAMKNLPASRSGALKRAPTIINPPRNGFHSALSFEVSPSFGNGKTASSQFAPGDSIRGFTFQESINSTQHGAPMTQAPASLKQRGPYWRQRLQDTYDTLNVANPESLPLFNWADPAINRSLRCLCVLEKRHRAFLQR